MQYEPGIDRHVFESRWQQLADDVHTSPAEALPELADLIRDVLVEEGYDVTDPVARSGEEREVVAEYQAAREVADRVEQNADVDPGDVASAINGLSALHDHLLAGDGAEL